MRRFEAGVELEAMSETACASHGHRILVVDDNRSVRDGLVILLEGRGFRARGASNGREALEMLRGGFEACLILLDMTMPIMDGSKFRTAQRQDASLADIPIVVMAALSDPTKAAVDLGAVAGLAKPLTDPEQIVQLASAHCPRSQPSRVDNLAGQRAAQVLTLHTRRARSAR